MKGGSRIVAVVTVLLLGGAAAAALMFGKPAPRTAEPDPESPPQVDVVHAEPRDTALEVTSQGTVAPRREIDLVVEVGGKVQHVDESFVEGGFFQEGELLLEIDPRDYELALVRAEARVAEAVQALASEKGQARQAEREWRDLGNEEANQLFLRKPQLAAAEAQLEAARAERDQARLDLERTELRAPFSGRVREALADTGQYLSPGARVGRIYDNSRAEVRLPLTDRQVGLLDLPLGFRADSDGPAPEVTVAGTIGGETYQWRGRITRTDPSIDVENRFYYAVAEVEQPADGDDLPPLVVGMFVEARIGGRQIADVVELPRRALFSGDQIYALDADDRVQQKTVRVLKTTREQAWVTGELAPGEEVVVGGQQHLLPGTVASPQPAREYLAGPDTGS